MKKANGSRGLESVVAVPAQTPRVGKETGGWKNGLAFAVGEEGDGGGVFGGAQAAAEAESEVVGDGDQAAVEEAIESGGEAEAVGGVGAAFLIDAPRNDVAGDEALGEG